LTLVIMNARGRRRGRGRPAGLQAKEQKHEVGLLLWLPHAWCGGRPAVAQAQHAQHAPHLPPHDMLPGMSPIIPDHPRSFPIIPCSSPIIPCSSPLIPCSSPLIPCSFPAHPHSSPLIPASSPACRRTTIRPCRLGGSLARRMRRRARRAREPTRRCTRFASSERANNPRLLRATGSG